MRFRNWWPDFNPHSSFIPRLMRHAVGHELQLVQDHSIKVDYEVHSVFCTSGLGQRIRSLRQKRSSDPKTRRLAKLRSDYGIDSKGPAAHHIWYTGENLRPPDDWDVTLSFDLDSFSGSNWYLPHWAIRLGDIAGHDPSDPLSVRNQDLITGREATERRPRFAVVLAGNPHPIRSLLSASLAQIEKVDTFGAAYGRPVASKMDLFKQYRFAIVPENDLYPGYVTEKVVEAWLAGCIPIWWGTDAAGYLNQDAHLNLATTSLEQLIETVWELDSDDEKQHRMTSQPILMKPYDFDACVDFMRERLQIEP